MQVVTLERYSFTTYFRFFFKLIWISSSGNLWCLDLICFLIMPSGLLWTNFFRYECGTCWSEELSERWNTPWAYARHFCFISPAFYIPAISQFSRKKMDYDSLQNLDVKRHFRFPFSKTQKKETIPPIVQKVLKGFRVIQRLKLVCDPFLKVWPLYSGPLRTLGVECSC